MAECDLVLDQLYSDSACGKLGAEAGVRSIPELVAGRSPQDLKRLRNGDLAPTHFVATESFEAELLGLCSDKARLRSMGHDLRRYLSARWSEDAVARSYLELLKNRGGSQESFDPMNNIEAPFGGYADEPTLKEMITKIVRRYDSSALGLDHNPSLRDCVLRFAKHAS